MLLEYRKKNYIITLIDASENEINGSVCMEGFAHHQFLMVDKGGFAISQEMKEMPFSAGDVIYVAAGRRFGLRCEGSMRIRHIAFSGRNIRPLLHYCNFGEFCITPTQSGKNDIDAMFDEIFKGDNTKDKNINLSASLYTLLARLGEINIENGSAVPDKKHLILRHAVNCMQEHYRNPKFPYAELASSLDMTVSALDKLFFEEYSMTGAEFYKKLRIENAKHLLFFYASVGSAYVAKNMGYENESELESDFYEQFGMHIDEFVGLYWNSEK